MQDILAKKFKIESLPFKTLDLIFQNIYNQMTRNKEDS